MARKIAKGKIVADGVMTGTSVISTPVMDVSDSKSFAFQFTWTSTAQGTFAVLGSVDGTSFVDMGLTITAASGTAGTRIADITASGVAFVYATYTNTASTGVLQVYFNAKEN